ncbi:hypothetical protein IscW_ISCW020235 [Ixodes scapularis]|uniref:Uncharacterized protein n=1 Tax=Ixodes scapularis TaxID=6945 RepID=B7Q1M7_IXOSC|nr:hypothetical protein IscW_ISCW020235 [Ixodes scapularis]|eukprot:XP_002409841.1 hypothetical protein IscW_ISCW020235 [Ixodes scapularis]
MVTPVHIHTFGGGNVGTNLASSLTGGSSGGTSVSAGPTYLIQELRHHNTPASTKSHSGGGGGSGHSAEKLVLLKDFKDLKAFGAGTPILKTKKVIAQNSHSDNLKGLGAAYDQARVQKDSDLQSTG